MKEFLTICLISLLIVVNVQAQNDLRKVKNVNTQAGVFESYFVLKDNKSIKQGVYLYRYRGKEQVKGQFENNMQIGEWVYSPNNDFKIVGTFTNGKKDGEWKYYKNKNLISVLNYENGKLEGTSNGYYENGQIACETYYKNNELDGLRKLYYSNGQIKESIKYIEGKKEGDCNFYSESGDLIYVLTYRDGEQYNLDVKNSNSKDICYGGNLKDGNGIFIIYTKDSETEKKQTRLLKTYKNGKLHGSIKGYTEDGKPYFSGQYMNGYMVGMWNYYINSVKSKKSISYNYADSIKLDSSRRILKYSESFIDEASLMPGFDNGDKDNFRYHIMKSLQYPLKAQENGISGRVYVDFKVGITGLVYDVNILESDDPILNAEALRVVKSSPLWIPGFNDQLPVSVHFTFPIIFQLQ